MKNPLFLSLAHSQVSGEPPHWPLRRKAHRIVVPAGMIDEGQRLVASSADLVRKLNLCGPMCATDDVRSLVDKTVARFGPLDVAVNNAGTGRQTWPVNRAVRRKATLPLRHNVLGTL